ncbi:MAG: TadE/TadG family protein [Hyphomicrobiaceae bacterium]|nr:TadE/TadG family protein [Hyphomicrobiaceae bacterium]
MLLKRFIRDKRGSIALTFSLSLLPIAIAIGVGMDYGRALKSRSAMQNAADATALALTKYATTLSASDLNTKADSIFKAIYRDKDVSGTLVTTAYSNTDGSQLKMDVTGTLPTTFLNLISVTGMNVGVTTTVKWGQSRLRVALALDNTGSMSSDGKMTALKTATKSLLTQLKDAAKADGDVYVSIIPFSRNVNAIDLGPYTSNWIRWTNTPGNSDAWDSRNGTCSGGWGSSEQSCTGTWTPKNHNTWNGCIMDRDQNYDVTNTAPTLATPQTLFPAQQYSSCPEAMMGLSHDWASLNAKVDAMNPTGNTNQAIGLAWAWQSLTASPFAIPAEDPDYTYQKVIILLTDGMNTQNRWTSSQSTIDGRQATMCANIKAAGITLYTVQVNTDGDPTSNMLRNCASGTDKFFMLTSANAMVSTFAQIGTSLTRPRIDR